MNAVSSLPSVVWTVLVPVMDEVPAPEDVKPGWLGFSVFLLLAAALVVLFFSFRKQLRKVDFEEEPEAGTGPDDGATGPEAGPGRGPRHGPGHGPGDPRA